MTNRKPKNSIETRVLEYIRSNQLVEPGQKVLAAVSGGPDSVCLLHVLSGLREELSISLHIAHLDHGLRGREAEEDAVFVADLARKLDIPAVIERRNVKNYQKTHRLSLEEAAREVRYNFLAQTAESAGAGVVATGHTLNDQAETILLHIIRGSGTRGLRGLQPVQLLRFQDQKLKVVRPLLDIQREETVAYCESHGLSPRTDSTNFSTDLLRNRVRHELLPLLKDYNPGIVDSVLRLSRIAADDLDFIEAEAFGAWKRVVSRFEGEYIFDKSRFLSLAPALQRQLLRRAIEELLGTLKDIETRHIEEIMNNLNLPSGRRIDLPAGLDFCIEYDRYLLGTHPEKLSLYPAFAGEYQFTIPGVTLLPGWRVEAVVKPVRQSGYHEDNPDPFSAFLDFEKTGGNLVVRTWRRGDCFQPLGLGHEKKVAEFLLDARIPRLWRKNIPVFCNSHQIVWIAGCRIDDRVKVTSSTRHVLGLIMNKI